MRQKNYSFIIPHRNSPDLLLRCLNSIPEREDIEIIIVDDNSEKGLKPIVERRDTKVILLSSDQSTGAGGARNRALEAVQGKWIVFADADDFFHDGALEAMDNHLSSDADIVFFDVDSCFSDTLASCPSRIREISYGISHKDIEYLKWKVHVLWGKMYSSDLIKKHHIRCDEVKASNDVMFVAKACFYSERCLIDEFVLYCSTVNLKSLCFSMDKEGLDARYSVALDYNRFIHKMGKGEYQINTLSLFRYYKVFGVKECALQFIAYIRDFSLKMKYYDVLLSGKGLLNSLINKSEDLSKYQKVDKK